MEDDTATDADDTDSRSNRPQHDFVNVTNRAVPEEVGPCRTTDVIRARRFPDDDDRGSGGRHWSSLPCVWRSWWTMRHSSYGC